MLVVDGDGYNEFIEAAKASLSETTAATMLTPGIYKSYCDSMDRLAAHKAVTTIARGLAGGDYQGQAGIFETTAEAFGSHKMLQDEVFGASTLIVRCKDTATLRAVIDRLEGQLTIALHIDRADYDLASAFIPLLERKAGRLIVNGFGTGVEVCHAMVHGGPFPATSDARASSVGSLAINRFLRPISYQAFPTELLSPAISDENQWNVPQRIDPKA